MIELDVNKPIKFLSNTIKYQGTRGVVNSAVQGIVSVWHLNSFIPFKNAGRIKQEEGQVEHLAPEGTLCCMLWRDEVRGEGRKE